MKYNKSINTKIKTINFVITATIKKLTNLKLLNYENLNFKFF